MWAVHDDVAPLRTVEQHTHVKFEGLAVAWLVDVLGHQYAVHLLALVARLRGHQVSTENARSRVLDVLKPFCKHHSVAACFRHRSLSTATRMDLRLDHKPSCSSLLLELNSHSVGLFWTGGYAAFLDGYTELLEDGLALEFVKVHGGGCSCCGRIGAAKLAFGRSFRTCSKQPASTKAMETSKFCGA